MYWKSIKRREYIAISPSGNYYGSEQTLMTYLRYSELTFFLFLPSESNQKLQRDAQSLPTSGIGFFQDPKALYLKLVFKLILGWFRNVLQTVYVNEAGHLRYIIMLSKLFKRVEFVIHVRLTEDVSSRPWRFLARRNLKVLATSRFIQSQLEDRGVAASVLSSPFRSKIISFRRSSLSTRKLIVVSRLSEAKGICYYERLVNYFESSKYEMEIHHFGECDYAAEKVVLRFNKLKYVRWIPHGFEPDKSFIFSAGIVLHLNPNEPLGVVLLEALNHSIPFLTFDAGGTGEISRELGAAKFLLNFQSNGWEQEALRRLLQLQPDEWLDEAEKSRKLLESKYGPERYAFELDRIFCKKNDEFQFTD